MAKRKVTQIRGDRLVERIYEVAQRELDRRGFEGFSIEAVARRAAVNKTTIYRRWPTREALALGAIEARTTGAFECPDQGSLDADLTLFLERSRALFLEPHVSWLLQVWASTTDPDREFRRILPVIGAELRRVGLLMLGRCLARGELAPGTDLDFVYDSLFGGWVHLTYRLRQLDEATLVAYRTQLIRGIGAR